MWNQDSTRYDFIFSVEKPIDIQKKDEWLRAPVSLNLSKCDGHSGCLFKDLEFNKFFHRYNLHSSSQIFKEGNTNIVINHQCSSRRSPPIHISSLQDNHVINWASPLICREKDVNQKLCYVYNDGGQLIDLTSLSKYQGDYRVETDELSVKVPIINICNAASTCGPDVAFCYQNDNVSVDGGYLSSSNITFNSPENLVQLTMVGQNDVNCPQGKVITRVDMRCYNSINSSSMNHPKLVKPTKCLNIIEWTTSHACPLKEISFPAKSCGFNVSGFDFKLNELKKTTITIPRIGSDQKAMSINLCGAFSKGSNDCSEFNSDFVTACIKDVPKGATSNGSQITGLLGQSSFRFIDDQLFWESYNLKKTCEVSVGQNQKALFGVGVRIKFVCSDGELDLPSFNGIEECTYTFEWSSKYFCRKIPLQTKNTTKHQDLTSSNQTFNNYPKGNSDKGQKPIENRSQQELVITGISGTNPGEKSHPINPLHKFLMIGLIIFSLISFIVGLLILDRRTQVRIPLGGLRRRFRRSHNRESSYNRLEEEINTNP